MKTVEDLMQMVKSGDAIAFEKLVEILQPIMFRHLLGREANHNDAEDAVSEALFNIWRNRSKFDPSESVVQPTRFRSKCVRSVVRPFPCAGFAKRPASVEKSPWVPALLASCWMPPKAKVLQLRSVKKFIEWRNRIRHSRISDFNLLNLVNS